MPENIGRIFAICDRCGYEQILRVFDDGLKLCTDCISKDDEYKNEN